MGENRAASAATASDTRRLSLDDSKRGDGIDTTQEGVTQGRCVWFCTREEPISEYTASLEVGPYH